MSEDPIFPNIFSLVGWVAENPRMKVKAINLIEQEYKETLPKSVSVTYTMLDTGEQEEITLPLWETCRSTINRELKALGPRKRLLFEVARMQPREMQLDIQDAAELLGIHRNTAGRWLNEAWETLERKFKALNLIPEIH